MDGKKVTAVIAGAAVCAFGIWAYSAKAQGVCAPQGDLLAEMAKRGLKAAADLSMKTKDGSLAMRLIVNPKTNAWMLITLPDPTTACIVLVGNGFELARLPGQPI
jgi:hypothetical protein